MYFKAISMTKAYLHIISSEMHVHFGNKNKSMCVSRFGRAHDWSLVGFNSKIDIEDMFFVVVVVFLCVFFVVFFTSLSRLFQLI